VDGSEHDRHDKDAAFHASFDAKPANVRISARLMVRSPIMRGLDFTAAASRLSFRFLTLVLES
jgi:hypothetical protein